VKSCASSLSSNDSHASHACFARVEESSTPRVRFTPGHSRYDCTSRSGPDVLRDALHAAELNHELKITQTQTGGRVAKYTVNLQDCKSISLSRILTSYKTSQRNENEYRPTNIAKSCRHHSPMLVSCRKKHLQNIAKPGQLQMTL
jgi:hypothetical protein